MENNTKFKWFSGFVTELKKRLAYATERQNLTESIPRKEVYGPQPEQQKFLRLKSGELERIVGAVQLGTITIRALDYITSDVDQLESATRFHRGRIERSIEEKTAYRKQFKGLNTYVLGEGKEEHPAGCSFVIIEYPAECYRMEEGAHCKVAYD